MKGTDSDTVSLEGAGRWGPAPSRWGPTPSPNQPNCTKTQPNQTPLTLTLKRVNLTELK